MRVLLTGGSGFVGRHSARALRDRGHDVVVASRPESGDVDLPLDLCDDANLRGVVEMTKPDAVLHLAGQASVRDASDDEMRTYDVNALGTARLVRAIVASADRPVHVILASSGEVYGPHPASAYPLDETRCPEPISPYAASKVAAEAFARAAAAASERVSLTIARMFNAIGPGQDARFVTAGFARQLAAIASGTAPDAKLWVGNLKPQRDFLDVRDVAVAYALMLERRTLGTFNLCSGKPVAIAEILRTLVTVARVGVEIRERADLFRATDHEISFGSNAKLVAATGWAPTYALGATLRDVYAEALEATKARA